LLRDIQFSVELPVVYCLTCPRTQRGNHYVAYRLAPKPVILSDLHM